MRHMAWGVRLALFGAAVLSAGTSFAKAPAFELKPPSAAEIGKATTITGTVSFPAGPAVRLVDGQNTGDFELTDVRVSEPRVHDAVETREITLTVVPFNVGTLTFPALDWSLVQGAATTNLKSPPVKVEVAGQKPPEDAPLRDIRPPLGPATWPVWLAAALLLCAAGWAARSFYLRRGKPADFASEEPKDLRAPHEIALEALQRLEYASLVPKEYYDQMSDILRTYLERRFGIPALTLTSSDVVRQMRQAEIDRKTIAESKELFDQCDLAKFAKFQPAADTAERDKELALGVVRATVCPHARATHDGDAAFCDQCGALLPKQPA
ncbi:MAG: hypothetical protein HY078_15570 [Elusimicrobia bacterium]|nr:hypothetical protein [Elusimicrobiota bacterium]